MRRLILLRHAKAERGSAEGRDHDRVLEPRGRDDARRIGVYLAQQRLVPDRALVSTAARTRETWALAAGTLASAPPVEYEDRLYAATPQTILQLVRAAPPDVPSLIVVGHNPEMHEIAVQLVADADRHQIHDFPTTAMAVIDFNGEQWARLAPGTGRLERFVTPRSLAGTD